MGNYDIYRSRLEVNGSNETETAINSTKQFVNDTFVGTSVEVYGVDSFDAIISNGKNGGKNFLFRPDTIIYVGNIIIDYTDLSIDKYIVNEVVPNEIYPKAKTFKCNNELKFLDDDGLSVSTPCYITNVNKQDLSEDKVGEVNLIVPQESLVAWIPYDSTNSIIKQLDTFIINGRTWEVKSIDNVSMVDGNNGIIQILMGVTASESTTSNDGTTKQNWW